MTFFDGAPNGSGGMNGIGIFSKKSTAATSYHCPYAPKKGGTFMHPPLSNFSKGKRRTL